nr:FkbM family methyltransferase [Candidatus Njordarchaeota archaeon]
MRRERRKTAEKLKRLLIRDGKLYFYVYPSFRDVYVAKLLHEKPITKVVFGLNPSVALEVGAHIGTYVIRLARRNCRVIAVEADRRNYALLKANVKINDVEDKVEAYNFAAFSKRTELEFYLRSSSSVSGLDPGECTEKRLVAAYPLDILSSQLTRLDLMLVDVEGGEVQVLKGANKLLEKTRYVVVEVFDRNKDDVLRILRGHKFKLNKIGEGLGFRYFLGERGRDRELAKHSARDRK